MRHRSGSGARARLLVRRGVAVTGVLTAEGGQTHPWFGGFDQMARVNSAKAAES